MGGAHLFIHFNGYQPTGCYNRDGLLDLGPPTGPNQLTAIERWPEYSYRSTLRLISGWSSDVTMVLEDCIILFVIVSRKAFHVHMMSVHLTTLLCDTISNTLQQAYSMSYMGIWYQLKEVTGSP